MTADSSDVSRRQILTLLGVTAVVAASGVVVYRKLADAAPVASAPPPRPPAAPVDHAAAEAALTPLHDGSAFARWTVEHVGPVEAGAVAVTVSGADDDRFILEVMARDDAPNAPRAPGESKLFAVYVRNHGDGDRDTSEEHGLAAMTLATIIARSETEASASAFLSLSQRLARFPDVLGRPGTVAL